MSPHEALALAKEATVAAAELRTLADGLRNLAREYERMPRLRNLLVGYANAAQRQAGRLERLTPTGVRVALRAGGGRGG